MVDMCTGQAQPPCLLALSLSVPPFLFLNAYFSPLSSFLHHHTFATTAPISQLARKPSQAFAQSYFPSATRSNLNNRHSLCLCRAQHLPVALHQNKDRVCNSLLPSTSPACYQRVHVISDQQSIITLVTMSNKMELSLDEILKTSKKSGGRGRGGRRSNVGRPATTAAPVGGVAKTTKQSKPAKAAPSAPTPSLGGETKIMVSNLVCQIFMSTQ